MNDVLERLKATTKVNGAYPKDIADAILEIEWSRQEIVRLLSRLGQCEEAYYDLTS